MVENLVLNSDFRTYIRRYTSPNENFEYGYPHSNTLLQSRLKFDRCKPHKAARRPTKCDVINDVKLFLTVYRRLYCRKFLTLSNQMPSYKIKCIRIPNMNCIENCGSRSADFFMLFPGQVNRNSRLVLNEMCGEPGQKWEPSGHGISTALYPVLQ